MRKALWRARCLQALDEDEPVSKATFIENSKRGGGRGIHAIQQAF